MLYDRLFKLLRSAPPGTIQVTGLLGLAILVWGLYHRTGSRPSGPSRRRPEDERQGGPSTATRSQAAPSTSAPAPQARATAAKPTPPPTSTPSIPVSGSVRSAMTGIKRVTMSVPGVLLQEWQAHELSDSATVREPLVGLVQQIGALADLYLIAHVMDDVGEAAVTGALEECGLVGTQQGACVRPHRLLFCSTLEGKVSIVRQLEPDLHIDGHALTVKDLQRFMPQLLHVVNPQSGSSTGAAQPNVAECKSLSDFFGV